MDWQKHAHILANDLNSMVARIEALPGHPRMTDALIAVQEAEKALREAWGDLHQQETRERYRERPVLTPMHIRLLRRGESGEWIGLSDDAGTRVGEVAALGELERMGLVEPTKEPLPPGPPAMTPSVLTEAGRKALAAAFND